MLVDYLVDWLVGWLVVGIAFEYVGFKCSESILTTNPQPMSKLTVISPKYSTGTKKIAIGQNYNKKIISHESIKSDLLGQSSIQCQNVFSLPNTVLEKCDWAQL